MAIETLLSRLAARIRAEGPLRFDDFQSAALYDPEGGYYEQPGRVGRSGDFVTGASWHPAFARCVLRALDEVRSALGLDRVDLLDVGAGEGEFLRFAADAVADRSVRLLGVEASRCRREAAQARVPEAQFFAALGDVPSGIRGVVHAYELFDALPVRALEVGPEGAPCERRVGLGPDGLLRWVEAPCPDAEGILAVLDRRGVSLEPGQRFEIRPGAPRLAASLARPLEAGLVLVFDYGAPARALYGPARPLGTLEAFVGHRVTRDVLAEPGSRDITAWVDLAELAEAWTESGLEVHGPLTQSRFLVATGILGELDEAAARAPSAAERAAHRNAVAKLFAPGGMGDSIRVLLGERKTKIAGTLANRRVV